MVKQLFDSIKNPKFVNTKQIETEFRRLTGRKLAFTTLRAAYESFFGGERLVNLENNHNYFNFNSI